MDKRLKDFNFNQLRILTHVVGDIIISHQHKEGGKCVKLMQDLLGNINKEIKCRREKGQ